MNESIRNPLLGPPDASNGYGRLAARSSAMVGVAKLLRYGFVYIVHVILMNLLDPDDFGLVRYVTIVLGVLNLINEAGLSVAIVQKKELDAGQLGSVFTLNLIIGCVLYSIVWLMAPFIAVFFREPALVALIRVGALALPAGGMSVVHRALLQRNFNYGRMSIVEVFSAVTATTASLVLALAGFGVWALVWGTVLFHAVSTMAFLVVGPRVGISISRVTNAVPLFAFGVGVVGQRIIDYLISNVDYAIVGRAFGSAALGIYGVAYDFIALPQMALGVVLGSVAMSAFSRFQDDDERLSASFLKLTLAVSLAATPFLVFVGSMASELMRAVTIFRPDDKWLPAVPLLRILAPVGLIYSFTSYPGVVWIAKGRIMLRIVWGIAALVTVVAAVLIGRLFGLTGVCWALLIRALVFFPVILFLTQRVVELHPLHYLQTLVPALSAGFAMAAVLLVLDNFFASATLSMTLIRLGVGGCCGLGVYLLVLYFGFRESWNTVGAVVVRSFGSRRQDNEN